MQETKSNTHRNLNIRFTVQEMKMLDDYLEKSNSLLPVGTPKITKTNLIKKMLFELVFNGEYIALLDLESHMKK